MSFAPTQKELDSGKCTCMPYAPYAGSKTVLWAKDVKCPLHGWQEQRKG